MTKLSPVNPTYHGDYTINMHSSLESCSRVFLWVHKLRSASISYTGLQKLIARNNKCFTIGINDKPITVSIDRLKLHFNFQTL